MFLFTSWVFGWSKISILPYANTISVPFKIEDGLPIGIQIMANHMDEHSLLQAAYALEKTVSLPEVEI